MKALEDFMYKGKHVRGGDEVAIDVKDVPKLRGLGKIPVPQDSPAKKKAKIFKPTKSKKYIAGLDDIPEDSVASKDDFTNSAAALAKKDGKTKRKF